MKVLVTGATGYIGGAVADRLVESGYEVYGLARSEEAAANLQSRDIQPKRGNLDQPEKIAHLAEDVDAVVHTAFQWGKDVTSTIQAERLVTDTLLSALSKTGKQFIFTSGTSVLGDTGTQIFGEETPIGPHPLDERLATELSVLQSDCKGCVIRAPNVYGRGDGQALFAALRDAGKSSKAIPYVAGTEEHLWSFVHVDDLAALYELVLAKTTQHELFHAGAQSGLQTQDIARALSYGMGWHGRTVTLPLEEMRTLFPVPALADYWARNSQSSRDKAVALGWSPEHKDMLEEIATERQAASG